MNNRRVGVRNGKKMAAVMAEVYTELTVHPPASKEEVQAFLRLQIKRCRVNLANAKDRGDLRAQANISRKLACYEYLNRVVSTQADIPQEATRECPYCKVHAVDIFGICRCCGKTS